MTLAKRSLVGSLAGIANFGVTLLQNLVTVPLLLHFWGAEVYGVWLAVAAATTLLAALDMGHQGYLGNEFNKDFARGPAYLKACLASGLRTAVILGLVQLVFALVLLHGDWASRFLGISPAVVASERLGWVIVMLVADWFLLSTLFGVLGRLYMPYGLFARATVIGILQRSTQVAVLLTVACLHGNLFDYAMAYSAAVLVMSVLWFFEIRRTFPELYPWWSGGNWRLAWINFSRSTVLTINGVVTQLATNGLNLVIAATQSAAMVPAFSTVRTVSNTFYQATSILLTPLGPDLTRFHVCAEWQKLRHVFRAAWFGGGLAINFGLVATMPFVPMLFAWWTHGRVAFDAHLFVLLACSVSVRSASAPVSAYLIGLNSLSVFTMANLLQCVVTLAVSFASKGRLGLTGFGLGVLLGEFTAMVAYLLFARRTIGDASGFVREFMWLALMPTLIVLALLVGTILWPIGAGFVAAGGSILIGVIYIAQWHRLPREIKDRIRGLMPVKTVA